MAATPSSESEVKLHPYQKAGPKGAYEIKQVYQTRDGVTASALYIRVDMPGVPPNGVKVVKYSDKRTVTFTGKAPMVWPHFNSSERVYAGYVALDRDPVQVKEEYFVKNGCFRLFLPSCDGSLHFLSLPNSNSALDNPSQALIHDHDDDGDDDTVEINDYFKFNKKDYITFIEHAPKEASGIKLRGGRPTHINPYLISGTKGVYEHKIVKVAGDSTIASSHHLVYVRVDVPMIDYRGYCLNENPERIQFALDGAEKDSPFDEGQTRGFIGTLKPKCKCCAYEVVQQDFRDGVIRFLARKSARFVQGKLETYFCRMHGYELELGHGGVPKLRSHTVENPIIREGRLYINLV